MNPEEVKEILNEAVYQAIEERLGLDRKSLNGAVSNHISMVSAKIAEHLSSHMSQKEFDLFFDEEAPENPSPGSIVSERNALNDLTGSEWLWFTKSVMRTSYPSILGHELRKKQGGNKPPQLMQELIEFFTKPAEIVLDPFAGAGGTALGAHLAGRRSINIELNPESIAIYHRVCELEGIQPHQFREGDCREALDSIESESVDFIATDPPYSPELEKTVLLQIVWKEYIT